MIIWLIIITILCFINNIFSQRCQNGLTISIDTNCYTAVLFFNNKNYIFGHFAINNKGDMIVEYSDDNSRLFYGLKANGRPFFDTENNIKELAIQNGNDATQRYESNNIFIYLEDDIKKEKGYLFSASSYISTTELHDLENGDYKVKLTHNFMGIRIYGYIFSLLQAKQNNKNIYFCVFNHGTNSNLDNGQYFSIKKF